MAYELSFADSFFTGEEETIVTDTPTSVLEAIENLTDDEKLDICKDVFGDDIETAKIRITTEMFAWDVLDVVRETNTCENLNTPVRVYIDEEGFHSVDVY